MSKFFDWEKAMRRSKYGQIANSDNCKYGNALFYQREEKIENGWFGNNGSDHDFGVLSNPLPPQIAATPPTWTDLGYANFE